MYPETLLEGGHESRDSAFLGYVETAWGQSADMTFGCHPVPKPEVAAESQYCASDEVRGQASKKRNRAGGDAMHGSYLSALAEQPRQDFLPAFMNDFEGEENVNFSFENEAGTGSTKEECFRMTQFINTLASRGTALTFDYESGNFHVLDGAQFEKEYCALRRTRGKKNQAARDRPFAQMHRAYVMVRGNKWASKGTVFRPKDENHAPRKPSDADVVSLTHHDSDTTGSPVRSVSAPFSDNTSTPHSEEAAVRAHDVIMQVKDPNGGTKIDLSLQHFLDVTGAGALYAVARGGGVPEHFGCESMQVRE
eukprot:2577641-Rhodomonas_salina.2